MTETILVGVTDRAAARRALDWAADRAARRHARLRLFAVVGGAIGVVGEGAVLADALRRTQDLLDVEAERVRAYGVPVETRVGRGDPVEQLIAASDESAMLVIGSDYRGPGAGPVRGPHGVRIVAGARCPVAVIPDLDLSDRSGVIVGVDGSETSEAAIRFAAAEADRTREVLTAVSTWIPVPLPLHIRSYSDEYLGNMHKLTEESLAISLAGVRQDHPDLLVRHVVETGHPGVWINRLGEEARLTVIGSHGHGRLVRLLVGSTVEQVLARLATATVVVR